MRYARRDSRQSESAGAQLLRSTAYGPRFPCTNNEVRRGQHMELAHQNDAFELVGANESVLVLVKVLERLTEPLAL